MNVFKFKPRKITTVIFDLAGTVIDKYSLAPNVALRNTFLRYKINPSNKILNSPMGIDKQSHIRKILSEPEVRSEWIKLYHQVPNEEDIDEVYSKYKDEQHKVLPCYSKIIDGVDELAYILRSQYNIKIGVTTGFPRSICDKVLGYLEEQDFKVDFSVASDEISRPRPHPDGIWKNMTHLLSDHPLSVIKIGDTNYDIQEGLNAGVVTIGVTNTSSVMGELLMAKYPSTENKLDDVVKHLSKHKPDEVKDIMIKARSELSKAKPHFLINDIRELASVVDYLNNLANCKYTGKDSFDRND